MKSTKKKRKRSRAPKPSGKGIPAEGGDEGRALDALMEAFSSASLEEVVSAYRDGKGDANKAAEVLGGLGDQEEDGFKSSTSSGCRGSSSGSCSSEGIAGFGFVENDINVKGVGGRKAKRVVAATGTVSTVLGKDYVASHRRGDWSNQKGFYNDPLNTEDMEQFLCSMLGNESQLSMAVVRDVLCHCGYDIEKSLDALLKLCSPSYEHSKSGRFCDHIANDKDADFLTDCDHSGLDGASDSTFHSSESEFQDNIPSMYRYSEVLANPDISLSDPRSTKSDLSQEVLESLFNIPKNSEHEPNKMSWIDVVKNVELLGHQVNFGSSDIPDSWQKTYVKGDEYRLFRKDAKQHWDSMRNCYKRAAAAYSNGHRQSASYHSEQGRLHNKMAREADERASKGIFKARNKSIENVITIDLHGQHVKQAMKLVKVHLLFGTYVHSIQFLRVITGCGSGTNGVGKSKLKQSVIDLVKKQGIEWREENPGSVLIKVDGQIELSFVDSEDDSE